jgi:hypothetical protein
MFRNDRIRADGPPASGGGRETVGDLLQELEEASVIWRITVAIGLISLVSLIGGLGLLGYGLNQSFVHWNDSHVAESLERPTLLLLWIGGIGYAVVLLSAAFFHDHWPDRWKS